MIGGFQPSHKMNIWIAFSAPTGSVDPGLITMVFIYLFIFYDWQVVTDFYWGAKK